MKTIDQIDTCSAPIGIQPDRFPTDSSANLVRRFASALAIVTRAGCATAVLAALTFISFSAGCASAAKLPAEVAHPAESQTLRAGDVVKISFPRAQSLDTTQQIRRDGKLNLYLVGEVQAAGLSPAEFETKMLELYASQLVSKEVRVTVVSSSFAVFVTGAVVRPGKLTPERALTAFEAIMEAGGFDNNRADTKAVRIIRSENGQTKNYVVNLKAVLEGKPVEPFFLQAYDTVYVPERFSWF
jgi:polysaccharide export outer membrane protein